MRYHIVVVADEKYVQHAAVMLTSLFVKNEKLSFTIHFFTNGISNDSQEKLQDLCHQYHAEIFFYKPAEELTRKYNLNLDDLPVGQWNTMVYFKLFIPILLPEDIERCLFLDVDMIINDDLSSLYQWNLNNKVIAAAEDIPDCVKIKKRLGLSQNDIYINSGVMVCNLSLWRKIEKERPIFQFVKQIADIITNEQDVIALYFKDLMDILPIRWNMTTFYFNRIPKIFPKYLAQLKEAKKNPGIIHFAAPIKPWFRDCQHPYAFLYKKYLRYTCWKNYKFPFGEILTSRQRFNKYIKNFCNKVGIMRYPDFPLPLWL